MYVLYYYFKQFLYARGTGSSLIENEVQNIDKLEFINESLATAVAEAAVQEYRPMRYSGLTERRCYRNYDRTIGLNKTWNQVL